MSPCDFISYLTFDLAHLYNFEWLNMKRSELRLLNMNRIHIDTESITTKMNDYKDRN